MLLQSMFDSCDEKSATVTKNKPRLVNLAWTVVSPEAAIQWCSYEKLFRKYAANLQKNTHAEVKFKFYWNHTSAWVFSCKFAAYF